MASGSACASRSSLVSEHSAFSTEIAECSIPSWSHDDPGKPASTFPHRALNGAGGPAIPARPRTILSGPGPVLAGSLPRMPLVLGKRPLTGRFGQECEGRPVRHACAQAPFRRRRGVRMRLRQGDERDKPHASCWNDWNLSVCVFRTVRLSHLSAGAPAAPFHWAEGFVRCALRRRNAFASRSPLRRFGPTPADARAGGEPAGRRALPERKNRSAPTRRIDRPGIA